jgi:BASS family bile acid:Na+ symporter
MVTAMRIDEVINLLAVITLIEMMVATGLGVKFSDVVRVGKNWSLVVRVLLANYILVPTAAVALLLLFHAKPMVAAGFLVVVVCPGAPYGPPFTGIAKGNVTLAVGLMIILAGSSAIVAPVLLALLLPLVAGKTVVEVNVLKMVGTLLGAQLFPLCVGLWIRHRRPVLADRLRAPARILSVSLNLLTLGVILVAQFRMLLEVQLSGYIGMLCLVIASMAAGWLMGGGPGESPQTTVLTTSVRNVGVGLAIAAGSFPGTAAISSATAYAIVQTTLIALVAVIWGRLTPSIGLVNNQAA